jgi:polyisoprenoid-binding protein YceI
MSTAQSTETTALPVGVWTTDPIHSSLEFSVKHMVVATFRSRLPDFGATLEASEDGAALRGVGRVASVVTPEPNLTAHLQSPDFFDAENAPELTFVSTGVSRDGDRVEIDGDLQIRGATQPVTLAGTVGKQGTDAYGQERFNLALATTIDRTQFGVDWNNPLPNGEPSLANDVDLTAELYLVNA